LTDSGAVGFVGATLGSWRSPRRGSRPTASSWAGSRRARCPRCGSHSSPLIPQPSPRTTSNGRIDVMRLQTSCGASLHGRGPV